MLVAPSIGLALVGLHGVTLLAAATVAASIGFGGLYLKYSEVVLTWLEARTRLHDTLVELEARARSLETAIDRAESPGTWLEARTQLQARLEELEARARSLETAVDRSQYVDTWLVEARTQLQDRLQELEARTRALETAIDRSESHDARVHGRTDLLP